MTSATSSNTENVVKTLTAWAQKFESTLKDMLTAESAVPEVLDKAVRYSILDGGKRVRPFITTRMCELCGGTAEEAAPAAVAIECVHAFSLVHDDLPAMDDDDLRRGKPTCHKAYGEAMAIMAGDALLALAFEILAARIPQPATAAAAVAELAKGCGWAGMIGGQVADILSENQPPDLALVNKIHRYKTARLIECAARLGAICAGANQTLTQAAADYGQQLGLAFQIADDILDLTGDEQQVGKAVAKDANAGKQTYPAAVGIDESQAAAHQAAKKAIEALEPFGTDADDLKQLARFVVERNK
ncbi:MAG: polyprenyl synthetase family protein [Planctomycetota bacterium]|nr:MAG: polyprenyl synthetase family protein [Planctomycetota bacterium]